MANTPASPSPTPPAPSTARLERSRLSNRAADAIKRRIVSGEYAAGARIPTEKALAEELGVTRLTVREALSQLSAAGFVEARHGSGTYARDVRAGETFAILAEMLAAGRRLSPQEALSLLDFRARVLGAFADEIAARVTATQLDALRSLVAEARATTEPAALAALDYRFNELLADASGNAFLTLLMRSLREVHVQLGTVVYREHGDVAAIVATLAALVDALSQGRAGKVGRVLQTYLQGATAVVSAAHARRAPRPR